MRNDVAIYCAVAECRRLYESGMSLPGAAAEAAEHYGVTPLHVSQEAAKAIEACREARKQATPEPLDA